MYQQQGLYVFFPAIDGIHTTVQHTHRHTHTKVKKKLFKEKSLSHFIISERPKDLLNTSTWSPGKEASSSSYPTQRWQQMRHTLPSALDSTLTLN